MRGLGVDELVSLSATASMVVTLLGADACVAEESRRVLDAELLPALPAGSHVWTGDARMTASAEGNARIHQVGRGTQHITER